MYYQISTPKIVLELYVSRNGSITKPDFVVYSDQYKSGQWTDLYAAVDSDVDAVVLHANKKGITTILEYVLVDPMQVVLDTTTGDVSGFMFSIAKCLLPSSRSLANG